VFGSTAVYRCIYSNEQKQSHASDLSDSANQGMAVGAKDGSYQCPKPETRTLPCPRIHYISNAHMSVHPQSTNTQKGARTLLVATPSMHRFFHVLSFEVSFSPLPAHLPSPMLVCAMHATAASPAPSPTAPAYSTWASTHVSPRSLPSAPSSRDGVARGGSSCRIGRRRLLH
jgi:hypothetical protein